MKRLEMLPEITDKALGGLNADDNMKERILAHAAAGTSPARRRPWAAALACALALVVGLSVGIPSLTHRTGINTAPLIESQPLGTGEVGNERALLDLRSGDVTISASNGTPKYRSIWSENKNGSFPLLGVNGRYYRLLTSPAAMDERLLGRSLGTVSEFTKEPALSSTNGLISNILPSGAEVFGVSGMENTLVAAVIDGSYRVFQRVSFNGDALLGKEKLSDTLEISGHVIAMELSDVGIVTDKNTCDSLIKTLMKKASYESSGSINGNQSLLIALDNGLTLQLTVKKDKLAGCGVWSCPEFIEAFEAAAE